MAVWELLALLPYNGGFRVEFITANLADSRSFHPTFVSYMDETREGHVEMIEMGVSDQRDSECLLWQRLTLLASQTAAQQLNACLDCKVTPGSYWLS